MKKLFFLQLVILFGLVLPAHADVFQPTKTDKVDLLNFIDSVTKIDLGREEVRVVTFSSFAEPDQWSYLVVVDGEGSAENDTASRVYNLEQNLQTDFFITAVENMEDNVILISGHTFEGETKEFLLKIEGLSVELINK